VTTRSQGTRSLQGHARALALEIAAEARAEWGFASEIIARSFRAHRELASGDRRTISETVYGLIRMDRRLDAILEELAGRDTVRALQPATRDALKLLIYEVREGLPVEAARAEAARLAVAGQAPIDLARAADEDAGLGKREGIEREAVRLSYPSWMLETFMNDLGPEGGRALADSMNARAPMALRANTALASREKLAARLAEEHVTAKPTPLAGSGLVLETRVNAFGLAAFREGLFEVMDEGSQLVADLVAPPPGGRVVDACAGAGGKTLAIGAAMAGKGRLLALDTDGKKLEELRRRARRAGLTNVTARPVIDEGTKLPAEARPGGWDRVLVDAPCSGMGTLRRNPEARWRLTPQAVRAFPARQLALLVTYAPLVAVGGRLIYATCSVVDDENEGVVRRFVAERDDFVRVPVAEAVGDGMTLRLFPHTHDTDGFFAAVLRRVK
jgi:16S rRNA (cytosine967-C5)-methyltransferase